VNLILAVASVALFRPLTLFTPTTLDPPFDESPFPTMGLQSGPFCDRLDRAEVVHHTSADAIVVTIDLVGQLYAKTSMRHHLPRAKQSLASQK
jgi:hypothetical protein